MIRCKMRQTIKYKTGYIHISYINNNEIVYCCVQPDAYTMKVRSVRAAKIKISKHVKRIKAV
jgi:hypothetical protein